MQNNQSIQKNPQAIVIGGSMAGLLAARVLSEQFERVTIVDRDQLPLTAEPRRGVPQSVQPHVLMTKGYRVLEEFFPGIGKDIQAAGAVPLDWGKDFLFFQQGSWMPVSETAVGLESYTCSRPLLESQVRQRVKQIPNVEFMPGQRVVGLCGDRNTIQGVRLQQGSLAPQDYFAQLVVDASGRSSQAPQWLKDLDIAPPSAMVIDPGVGYATRRYRIPAEFQPRCKVLLISQEPPDQPRLGYLAEVENQEWIATLGGYGQHYPPLEGEGFLQFAQQLANPAFYQAIAHAQPLSPIRAHRATANRLYHYEKIELPSGFVALGDAVCALCPVHGQGITVSALSALVLQRWLQQPQQRRSLSLKDASLKGASLKGASFQKQLAQSNAFPWAMATGFDSKFVTTKGAISPNWVAKLFQGYTGRLSERALHDRELQLQFIEMAHMLKPPSVLFHPRLVWRALF
ncbi:MAG: monooxygenase [Oculatellaceae cyanobacterium Prado106]|jgi:2-polyprenyl-6-methoxyphenol hydroxylase-like FAD-dependent oxidoreductase|nr:monooxygenase [Oculatellaceae cyanobacterium Prado106]